MPRIDIYSRVIFQLGALLVQEHWGWNLLCGFHHSQCSLSALFLLLPGDPVMPSGTTTLPTISINLTIIFMVEDHKVHPSNRGTSGTSIDTFQPKPTLVLMSANLIFVSFVRQTYFLKFTLLYSFSFRISYITFSHEPRLLEASDRLGGCLWNTWQFQSLYINSQTYKLRGHECLATLWE